MTTKQVLWLPSLEDATVQELTSTLLQKLKTAEHLGSSEQLVSTELQLVEVISWIHYAQNRLAPISRLPIEVTAKILFLSSNPELFTWNWLKFMLVCRQWRSILISFSMFWSTIHIMTHKMPPEFLSLVLHRSKEALLDLSIVFNIDQACTSDFPPLLKIIVPYSSRIQSLFISSDYKRATNMLGLLSAPAPQLETMTMNVEGDESAFPGLFAFDCDKLSHISINRSHWPQEISKSLRSINVTCVNMDWARLSECISFTPSLNKLCLRNVRKTKNAHGGQIVQLGQSFHLELVNSSPRILSNFQLAPCVSLTVSTIPFEMKFNSAFCVLTLPPCVMKLAMLHHIEKLEITASDHIPKMCVLRLTGSAPNSQPFDLEVDYMLRPLATMKTRLPELIGSLQPLSLSCVRELSMEGFEKGWSFYLSDWETLLSSMEGLQTLVVRERNHRSLLLALTPQLVATSKEGTSWDLFCPSLKNLRLLGGSELHFQILYDLVRRRVEINRRLNLLEIEVASLMEVANEAQLNDLWIAVDDLIWDVSVEETEFPPPESMIQ